MEICRLEELKSDLGAMMALSEKTSNDIRACLQVLHCLRAAPRITLTQIKATNIGAKDTQHGLFTIWQNIFQKKNMCVLLFDPLRSMASHVRWHLIGLYV